MNDIDDFFLYTQFEAEVNDHGVGESYFVVEDNDTWQPKLAHNFLPVQIMNSFCCDLGGCFYLYSNF